VRWLRARTIRARITIWSVLIAGVLLAIAAFAFRAGVVTIVASSTHALLESNGAPYEASILRASTKNFPRPGENQIVAVVDPKGKVRVSNLPGSLVDRMSDILELDDGTHVVGTRSALEYDVENEVVETQQGPWHVISARNRASGVAVLDGVDSVLTIGAVALVIGFGLASWIVTGLALRPVSGMRRKARQLSESESVDTLPVGPVRDELSELAETLNVFITKVRASADRERQMVADASHELRTPIAVLTTQLQLAHLSHGDADALEREIASAEQTLERLSVLTTNLLTLSRIEAADVDAPAETESDAIVAEFLSSMDRAIILGSSRSVTVDFRTTGIDPAATVRILPVDVAGLIDNLVGNAIAASSKGSAVDVELASRADRLVLTISDSGPGMPEDFLPVAFDRFTRTDSSRQQSIGGNGLGLAIVKAIVMRSGGEVRLERRPEGGLRAIVELPRADASVGEPARTL
jgi:two-component system OmpR family sensor kinase